MIERLKKIEELYLKLGLELEKEEVYSNVRKTLEINKERSKHEDAYNIYQKYKEVISSIEENELLIDDEVVGDIARMELAELNVLKDKLEVEMEQVLLPKDSNDSKNVIFEIRGAVGGDESNIFAGDLYRMYTKFADIEGFKIEELESEKSPNGGYSYISFMLKGKNVYSKLKYESGGHRVQRVPLTETQGRVHTSIATVVVMPEADEIDFELKESDLKVDVYRSGGAGGQHVNTTDSAVRMTHVPTGTVVTCQMERSQIKNRERALQMMRSKLYEEELRRIEDTITTERKSKVGSGDRSDKIRTYNYPQNRLTDHRIGYTVKQLDRVMEGDLEELINALINDNQQRKLEAEIDE